MTPARHTPLIVGALACALLVAACAGCLRASKHPIADVEAVGATVRDNTLLGMAPPQVEQRLKQALERSGKFALREEGERARKERAASLSLELAFTRESQKQGREGTYAEVGATLHIKRKVGPETWRYQVAAMGEEKVKGEDDRARAMRAAFDQALEQLVRSADLQLAALGKSDEALLADLKDDDAKVQEYALRVLAERRSPAVADVLVERLRTTEDTDALRRLMGALAEMREQKAVKPLIDLTRGRDPVFVREVVFALAQIGGDEAMAYLFTVAQGHDDPALREAAQKALAEVELRGRAQAGSPEHPAR